MYQNIVFWLDYPSFHVAPLIASVSNNDVKVIVICENNIAQWRLDMGFPYAEFGKAEVFIRPSSVERKEVVSKYLSSDSVHIFHGLRHTKENFKCFRGLVKRRCSIGLYFEPIKLNKTTKGLLRHCYYRLLLFRYGSEVDFMLALGDIGKRQFLKLGLPEGKVTSFNYFINNEYVAIPNSLKKVRSSTIKVLYVGQLVSCKNVVMLAKSFCEIAKNYDNVSLTIVGDGELKSFLHKYVENEGVKNKVKFLMFSSNESLKDIYSEHDVFILPSKFDGWGVVAVEAMARGLPVIVSDHCGSASIIKKAEHGIVFDSTSEQSLTAALSRVVENSKEYLSGESENKRLQYVGEHLSAKAGEKILLEILGRVYLEK